MEESFNKHDITDHALRSSLLGNYQLGKFWNQNYLELKNECLRNGRLFEDPYFRPSSNMTWKRPKQMYQNPKFIVNGANVHDLDQGELGNCWFIAGCAAVTYMPELFNFVVPKDQEFNRNDYAGIFHFRFWIYGYWYDVVVDDWLPVNYNGKLKYCSNREEPNEFWAALLEKAYAKIHEGYRNLNGGFLTDALIDMSGGINETIHIDYRTINAKNKNELWKIIKKSRELKSMNGASISSKNETRLSNGLVAGHAYTITKCFEIDLKKIPTRLIRMRNPWGKFEWKGAWSDNSHEWNRVPDYIKRMLEFQKGDEGEFWIDFEDFIRYFNTLEFCHITPDAYSNEILKQTQTTDYISWHMIAYHSEWIVGKTAGGCGNNGYQKYWTNPQFLIKLVDVDSNDGEDLATVIVSCMQKCSKKMRLNIEFIQFRLYRVVNQPNAESLIKSNVKFSDRNLVHVGNTGDYINAREITMRFRVKPGYYVIIPSTYNADRPGKFLLRIFTEKLISNENTRVLQYDSYPETDNSLYQNSYNMRNEASNYWTSASDADYRTQNSNAYQVGADLNEFENLNKENAMLWEQDFVPSFESPQNVQKCVEHVDDEPENKHFQDACLIQ